MCVNSYEGERSLFIPKGVWMAFGGYRDVSILTILLGPFFEKKWVNNFTDLP
jgi:hypothetical protein